MKMGIKKSVMLAFGTLIFLFFITAVVAYLLTTRILDDVLVAAEIGGPDRATSTALQLELRRSAGPVRTPAGRPGTGASPEAWAERHDRAVAAFVAASRSGRAACLPISARASARSASRASKC